MGWEHGSKTSPGSPRVPRVTGGQRCHLGHRCHQGHLGTWVWRPLSPRRAPAALSTSSLCCRPPACLGSTKERGGQQGWSGGGGVFGGAQEHPPAQQKGRGVHKTHPAALGPPAPICNPPTAKRGHSPPCPPLQERHLRRLRKDPPAVTKAQRPVQRVMMKMGPRLAA